MSIDEFNPIAGRKAKLESMENIRTAYKMYDYNIRTGGVKYTRFFYFDSNGRLYSIDKSTKKGF